jgi:hypothetical protein
MPSIAVSVSLSQEANLKLIGSMVFWCATLIVLSVTLDGWDRAIIARPGVNPRKAYNIITNKKIIDLIRQVKGQTGTKAEEEKTSNKKEREGKPDGSTTASSQIINFQFITNQRSLLLVATVVSILAVDFPLIFPRRLCKTEEYGVSLVSL